MLDKCKKILPGCLIVIMCFAIVIRLTSLFIQGIKKDYFYPFCFLVMLLLLCYFICNKYKIYLFKLKYFISVIFILSILLRVVFIFLMETKLTSDFNIPNVYYETGDIYKGYYSYYPAWYFYMKILHFIYDVLGYHTTLAKLANIVPYAVSFFILYRLSEKLFLKKEYVNLSLTLFAFFPPLIYFTSITTPDHFTILFIILFIYSYICAISNTGKKRYGYYLIMAISAAFAELFKPLIILFILVVFFTEIFTIQKGIQRGGRKTLINAVIVIALLVCCSQITGKTRNFLIEKEIGVKTVNSTSLYLLWGLATNENGDIDSKIGTQILNDAGKNVKGDDETEILQKTMNKVNNKAKEIMVESIPRVPSIIMQKLSSLFSTDISYYIYAAPDPVNTTAMNIYEKFQPWAYALTDIFSLFMFVMMIFASLSCWKQIDMNKIIIFLFVLGYIAMLLLGGMQPRYKIILTPLWTILSVYGINYVKEKRDHIEVSKTIES